jgi:hypothetical protein
LYRLLDFESTLRKTVERKIILDLIGRNNTIVEYKSVREGSSTMDQVKELLEEEAANYSLLPAPNHSNILITNSGTKTSTTTTRKMFIGSTSET